MKRIFLLLLAFSTMAIAQSMTGLPRYGVNFYGTIQFPEVTNTSSKAIFAFVIRSEGGGMPQATLIKWVTIPNDGASHQLAGGVSGDQLLHTTASIDAVVFEDGSFVGPDRSGSFPGLSRAIAAFVANGAFLLNATDKESAYAQLQEIAKPGPSSGQGRDADTEAFARRVSALQLVQNRAKKGDSDTAALAARFVALGTLRKVD